MDKFTVLNLLDTDLKESNFLSLSVVSGRSGLTREITIPKINRPGLAFSGFFKDFDYSAVQILGHGELEYIKQLEENNDSKTIETFFTYQIPCIVYCFGAKPSDYEIKLSENSSIPILVTPFDSATFSRRLYTIFDEVFAKTETIHGVLVEVFGIGVLITGDSGIGKSETALELIERGHRLISDDAVRLKNIADSTLIGLCATPALAHNMEIRGLGIIDVKNIYGVGAIREKKQVQLLVHLETWDPQKCYDRIDETQFENILGISIPKIVLPVRPGRNLPILIETAAKKREIEETGLFLIKGI